MPTVGTFLGGDSGGMEKLIMKQIVEKMKAPRKKPLKKS